jgi:hypothetical protein
MLAIQRNAITAMMASDAANDNTMYGTLMASSVLCE